MLTIETIKTQLEAAETAADRRTLSSLVTNMNKGRLRPRPELSRSHGKATSSFLANIGSFVAMPPFTKSSRLSCGAMVRLGSS